MAAKAWGGRFTAATDKKVEIFTESISFDHRLWPYDIAGSKAHSEMLSEVGLISSDECRAIHESLDQIAEELRNGQLEFRTDREDIHMHIESRLIELIGDIGRKLHTGRSRNDQVGTDFRLWMRDAIDETILLIRTLQTEFVNLAEKELDVIIPGYTHLQRAQPVLAAHNFLAYVEKLERDCARLIDCRSRVNVLSLGVAALAGTTLPIDRDAVCQKLGFDHVASNSIDVSSDRDFAIEYLSCLSLISVHLSNWAEEWIIWSTTEFGFLQLPDEYCTGSSIMPQKKNPDVLEIIRGKTGRVVGSLQTLLMLVKGLPLAYNRDLQEDKPAVFDAHDTVTSCVDLAATIVSGATLNRKRIKQRIEDGFLDATTLMEYLIVKEVPMRQAHEVVGNLVKACETKGCRLADLTLSDFQAAHQLIEEDVRDVLGVENAVAAFTSFGSTGRDLVEEQIRLWRGRLAVE